ncbi:hypothetical protein [Nocardioides gilvus]|uniref:hypothetical protein n=1 Tax=Nocardioides gilvus TaxID=1735589 RepID=UPI000D746EBF|nr:hypothetical protein [Nocardioides gilvus]
MLRLPPLFHRQGARRVSASLVAVAMGLTLLVGCSGEQPEPKFAEEPTAEPPSPTVDAAPKKETVKEFLVRWAEVEREMQNTGKTEEYAALSAGCQPCEALVKRVEEIYANDGFIRTDGRLIQGVDEKGRNRYSVKVAAAPTEYQSTAGAPVESLEGGESRYRIHLKRHQDSFVLAQLVEEGQ